MMVLLLLLLKGQHGHPSARASEKERDSQDTLDYAMKRGDFFFAPKTDSPSVFPPHSELAREKMWGRIHLIPLLQAEEDRDLVRRTWADKARERELLGKETKVYHSDRWVLVSFCCPFPSSLGCVCDQEWGNILGLYTHGLDWGFCSKCGLADSFGFADSSVLRSPSRRRK